MKKLVSIVAILALVAVFSVSLSACVKDGADAESVVTVQYVSEAPQAKTMLINGTADFALVGEPAATAFGTEAGGGFSARLNVQTAYSAVSGVDNFPQAGIFVKESVLKDSAFMTALFAALAESKAWVLANPTAVTAELQSHGSTATFPPASISRCALDCTALSESGKTSVDTFLSAVMSDVNFDNVNLYSVSGTETLSATKLRFAVPDGTPALAIAKMFSSYPTIAGKTIEYAIIPAATVATEIGGAKADIVIAPVNAGAKLIQKGAAYRMVSVAVEGSLYIVGKPEKVDGRTAITLDDLKGKTVACIGQGGTPDLVFKYIISKTEGLSIGE